MNTNRYIAFKGTYEKLYEIYEFDGLNWYLNIKDKNNGFQKEDTEKYRPRFLFADSLTEIEKKIKIAEYKDKYGNGESGDVQCPNCGFWHSFDYVDHNDGYYTAGINECFKEKRECLCGKNFESKIKEVKIVWETEEIKR